MAPSPRLRILSGLFVLDLHHHLCFLCHAKRTVPIPPGPLNHSSCPFLQTKEREKKKENVQTTDSMVFSRQQCYLGLHLLEIASDHLLRCDPCLEIQLRPRIAIWRFIQVRFIRLFFCFLIGLLTQFYLK